ncbi:MarR family winged helix-turn-helix transcriptional regulator [Gorillibacterium sp. sgz5001074]|uniref:MarR family winged helix-turn-helix transcriptional regulator n=1 Tax=Gorillibacterium sp. sgz5001074 TaxID=3446695 RepID=UPI003F674650
MMDEEQWILLEEADEFFRKMVRRFVKERDKVTVEGVTLPGLLILHKLLRDGEQRLGDLAEQLDLTSGAVTALCDKLENLGCAVRRRLPEDRRTVVLGITGKGRELWLRNRNIGQRCMTLLFEGFSKEELSGQIRVYRHVIDNLERFSSTLLELAKENAEHTDARPANGAGQPESKPDDYQGRHYLSY